jgi:hypothetical protein
MSRKAQATSLKAKGVKEVREVRECVSAAVARRQNRGSFNRVFRGKRYIEDVIASRASRGVAIYDY